jgi:hypothetical protein
MKYDVVVHRTGHVWPAQTEAEAIATARTVSRNELGPVFTFVNGQQDREYTNGKCVARYYRHSTPAKKAVKNRSRKAA